jgi:hypothetical protein
MPIAAIFVYARWVADEFPDLHEDPVHSGARDELDAFTHAYASALLTYSCGWDVARWGMQEYERRNSGDTILN